MDFETVCINGIHIPYLISWFDGLTAHTYKIENLSTIKEEYEKQILNMLTK